MDSRFGIASPTLAMTIFKSIAMLKNTAAAPRNEFSGNAL
jgi:hypothetical protein